MTTEDLETYLEAGEETQRIDYKGSCEWDVHKFAKDILALTNVQYGGLIIIGVDENQDGSFTRTGIEPAHKLTYKRDEMMDQMSAYADPHVNFSVDIVSDSSKIEYLVITVQPFQEVPVICRKNGPDAKEAGVYYRNRNKRPQSALVSSSYDMRDIINRAAVILMKQSQEQGFTVEASTKEKLKEELGEL
jgi:predicted HTH transcriptional regulator